MGPVDPKSLATELGGVSTWAASYQDLSIVSDGSGGRAARITLDKNTILTKPSGSHGLSLITGLGGKHDSACVSYRVRFDKDFDWSLGGKLPGLAGVAPGVPAGAPSGGHPTDEGWSGRLMWRGPGNSPSNTIVSYMYHPGQLTPYGDDVKWNRSFTAGRWHSVKQCYVMNTVGQQDGTLQAWLDGQLVVNQNNFVYRTRNDVHINQLYFTVFRGGSTMEWAGDRTGYVDIDDLVVTTGS